MIWQDFITSDKDVLLGKPILKGTRIAVEHIISLLAQGWSEDDILRNYPWLNEEMLKAVYGYVYDCMKDGMMYISLSKAA